MSKKINDLLKGVAITGAAVGGVSVLGDANIVYASEVEEVLASASGVVELEVQTEVVETEVAVEETVVEETVEREQLVGDVTVAEAERAEAIEDRAELEIQREEAVAEQVEVQSELTAVEEEKAEVVEQMEAVEEEKAVVVAQEEAKEEELAQTQAELTSKQEEYENAGYNQNGLAALEESIRTKTEAMLAKKQEYVDAGATYLTDNNFYTDYSRPLALEMIKYNLLLSGEINEEDLQYVGMTNQSHIRYSENFNKKYAEKHFCIRYINKDGVLCEKYYDYVTSDENGNSLIRINDSESDKRDRLLSNIYGINVVEKTPYYVYQANEDSTQFIYFQGGTEENKELFDALKKANKIKEVKINNKSYYVVKRDETKGFKVENNSAKGVDYYKAVQYTEDANNRVVWAENIEALSNKITEITETIDSLKAQISNYDGQLATLTETISGLEAQAATLQAKVDALDTTISSIDALIEGVDASIENYDNQIEALNTKISIIDAAMESSEDLEQVEVIVMDELSEVSSEDYYQEAVSVAHTQQTVAATTENALEMDEELVSTVETSTSVQSSQEVQQVEGVRSSIPANMQQLPLGTIEEAPVPLAVVEDEVIDIAYIPAEPEFGRHAEDIAMASALGEPSGVWHGVTLPGLGILATILGVKKARS